MQCRCSKKQQKIAIFVAATAFLIIGLLGLFWWPNYVEDRIDKMLPLKEGSLIYDKWIAPPIPLYMHIHLFNWTNTHEVRVPGVKPHFERLGPYVFRMEQIKHNITWNSNDTVSFMLERLWFFEPEMSNGTLEDLVTCPHLPTIAASKQISKYPKFLKKFFNIILNTNGGALHQTHTANEWLFEGFYDKLLNFIMKFNTSMSDNIKDNHFAWFLHRNGSMDYEGLYNINTGVEDLREMGEIKEWNGLNQTGYFEGECGRINGSTADLFAPNRQPKEWITVYMRDTCRIINLVPSHTTVVEGIEATVYKTQPDTYDSGSLNADMKCYCPRELQPDNCPKYGATDLSSCYYGAPLFLSHPNFLYADPSYVNTTTGTKQDPNSDVFFITMEPKLGVPLEVNVALQMSLFIQPDSALSLLKGIPSFYAPLFATSIKAKVTPAIVDEVKSVLNLPSIGFYIGVGLITLVILLLAIGVYMTVFVREQEPMIDEQTLIEEEE